MRGAPRLRYNRWRVTIGYLTHVMEVFPMPVIEVKLYDRRVTEESVPKMITALTDALAESSGAAKEHIQVVITGVDPKHWGIAGQQQS
jgi:4-oxalocrotonate tautomerase